MIIGRIEKTARGIMIFDVDGSGVHLLADDALDLAVYIASHYDEIEQIVARMNRPEEEEEQAPC